MFWSSDNGGHWIAANTGLTSFYVNALAIKGDTIFAGIDSTGMFGLGVWERPLSQILGIKEINNNAGDIEVYPNPVTKNLQIQTTLPIKEIEITDITGRLLCTTTAKTINCGSFASGVYFIKATTEKGVVVRKFIKE